MYILKVGRKQHICQKASLFGTSRPRSGGLIREVVDLKQLTYQCASPIVIRVFPVEFQLVHRRHAAAMAAPRLGTVLLLKSVQITERISTAVEKALGPIPTLTAQSRGDGRTTRRQWAFHDPEVGTGFDLGGG